ncbi:TMEM175 family protein [Acidipropionibacterium acidipropionici]|uniref:TMEM175 family protein n=1 Tax=Acidipropionibacterium acidipropionici TaxID=1748 RepID=UPI0039F5C429
MVDTAMDVDSAAGFFSGHWDTLLAAALSFVVVAVTWHAHHKLFIGASGYNATIFWWRSSGSPPRSSCRSRPSSTFRATGSAAPPWAPTSETCSSSCPPCVSRGSSWRGRALPPAPGARGGRVGTSS